MSRAARVHAYLRVVAGPLAIASALGAIAALGLRPPAPRPAPVVAVALPEPTPEPMPAEPPIAAPRPVPPRPAPEPDPAALAAAQADLDAAGRDRARADERAAAASDRLALAQQEVAALARSLSTLPTRLPDPSARIARARSRAEAAKAGRDQVLGELAALSRAPRPRRKPLVEQTPVARPPDGEESHFEVRRGRVAYIDLEGLLDRVRTDAKVQLRLAERLRPIGGTVGPVGAFSIRYEMSPDGLDLGDSLTRPSLRASYSLSGWEIVPRADVRGETLAQALQPGSDFARAVNRLSPGRDTVTLWVYPDGFGLYHRLRDLLHERGFLVAARPLPEGVAIRGSPSGSLSAGQ